LYDVRYLCAGAGLQLEVDVLEVSLDGEWADLEFVGDLSIVFALRHQACDLHFKCALGISKAVAFRNGILTKLVPDPGVEIHSPLEA
jgi:hypothetical protein